MAGDLGGIEIPDALANGDPVGKGEPGAEDEGGEGDEIPSREEDGPGEGPLEED